MTGTSEKSIACFPKIEQGLHPQCAIQIPRTIEASPPGVSRATGRGDALRTGAGAGQSPRRAARAAGRGHGGRGTGHDCRRLAPNVRTAIAFAVWEGAAREVGARKMRTIWVPLSVRG